ncbi:MAG: hypothetical protein AB1443_10240 [Pseudomonadota bacterium]
MCFLLASGLLLVLARVFGDDFVAALLPVFRWELELLDDHYRILFLGLTSQGADSVVRLDVTLARPVIAGARVIVPDPRGIATVTTLAGHVLQPAILMLAGLVAWPVRQLHEYHARVATGAVMLTLLLLVDVPFVLLAEIWSMFVEPHASWSYSPLIAWSAFLQSGGRLALALALSVFVVIAGQRFADVPKGLFARGAKLCGFS